MPAVLAVLTPGVRANGPRSRARTARAGLVALILLLSPGLLEAQDPPATARDAESLVDVPFIPQSELLCGGAAAAMMMRYWGADTVRAEQFRELVRPEEGGIRAGELAAEVERRGWRTVSFRGTAERIRGHLDRGRPVMALIEVEPGRHHFVVIVAWTATGVVYHDPARAPFRVRTTERFVAAWDATERWALLVLPPGDEREVDGGPPDPDARSERSAAPTAGTNGKEPDARPESRCRARVKSAVRRVRRGEVEVAETLLTGAVHSCPRSAAARTELAGLRARQERWEDARELAREATHLDPSEPHAWRILATSRFLTGDRRGALAAWNRIGEPTIGRVRIQGLDRTRDRPVRSTLGLETGRTLTPGALVRTSRRLELLPVAGATRLGYVPEEDGSVEVRASVVERPLLPRSVLQWGGVLAAGAARREIVLDVAGPTGSGELWTASARYEQNRPRLAMKVALPDAPILPGVVSLGLAWDRQTYRFRVGPANGTGGASGVPPEDTTVVEERRRAVLTATDWLTGRLRWRAGASVERWSNGALDGSVRAGLEARTLSGRLSVWTEGFVAASLNGVARRTYGGGATGVEWRSATDRDGPVLHIRFSGRAVTRDAPLAYWPGAGTGRARAGLLRAHPLLDDGVVTGPAFGRSLLQGGAEVRWWLRPVPGLALGTAGFVDVARTRRAPGSERTGTEVDGGAGIRLAPPGRRGLVRVDFARGLRSGGWHFEVGWDTPWPGQAGR